MVQKSFDEIVQFARTGLNPRKNFQLGNGSNKYITIKNIHNNTLVVDENTDVVDDDAIKLIHKRSQIKKGDILFCSIGRMGDMYIIEDDPVGWDINESVFAFTLDTNIIRQKYFYYIFKNQNTLDYLGKNSSGSTFKSIKMNQLKKMAFNLPSLEEQDLIVGTLDKVSSIIEARNNELGALDELIKARFVEMFGMPGSDSRGWGLTTLGDCCEINPKKNKDSRLAPGLEVSFVPMPAVSENGVIDATDIRLYDEVKTGFTYFSENDVLFAKITPCMENGKGAVATKLHNGIGFGSTEFHVLRPYVGESDPYWIYYLTTFETFRQDAEKKMTGSAGQRRVPATFLKEYKTALPPIELQKRFANFVQQVDKSKVA